jgi:hypothetical protein
MGEGPQAITGVHPMGVRSQNQGNNRRGRKIKELITEKKSRDEIKLNATQPLREESRALTQKLPPRIQTQVKDLKG